MLVLACGGDDVGADGQSDDSSSSGGAESTTDASTSAESTDTTATDTTAGDSTTGDTTAGDSTTTGDTTMTEESTTSDTEGTPSCEPPEDIVGCEGLAPPIDDTASARGILVEAGRAVLTFANVNDPAILCEEAELETCNCDSWGFATRFTIAGELETGVVDGRSVTVSSAAGDCEFTAGDDGTVVELEITEITATCVVGRAQIQDEYTHLPAEFGFVSPRCD